MIEPATDGASPRAFLRLGGHSLARHQLGLALALGAERVICLTDVAHAELLALQHCAEAAGVLFHRVNGLHALLALVSAADEIIALGDGLLAWPEMALELLGQLGVLVQPVEMGVVAGFERLDINHASASALRVPGRLFERMAEMPADVDVFATLQRMALQAGIPQRGLSAQVLETGRWHILRSEAEAQTIEPRWMALHAVGAGLHGPSAWLGLLALRGFGPALLHAGSNGTVVALAAGVLLALALVAGWYAHIALALGLCAMASVGFDCAALFGRYERRALLLARPALPPALVYGALLDGALLLVLSFQQQLVGSSGIGPLFAPLMLLGLVRLVPDVLLVHQASSMRRERWVSWLKDRALLSLVLGGAAMAGGLRFGVAAVAIGLLGAGLVAAGRRDRLTST